MLSSTIRLIGRGTGAALIAAALLLLTATGADAGIYTFQDGDTNGYGSTASSYILLNSSGGYGDTNYGTQTNLQTENQSTGGGPTEGRKSALVRFDDIVGSGTGQIPTSDQWIYRAHVTLRTAGGTYDATVDTDAIYPVFQQWDEGQVTFNSRLTGTPWSAPGLQPGVDHAATASDSLVPSAVAADYDFDVTAAARDMLLGVAPNYGWIVRDTNGADGAAFHSDNAATPAYRPKLTVDTMSNPIGGTQRSLYQQDTTANGTTDATYIAMAPDGSLADTNHGAAIDLAVEHQTTPPDESYQGIKRTLVAFPDAVGSGEGQMPLGVTVVSAKLAMVNTDPSAGPLYVNRVLQDWDEMQATYNNRLAGTPWATPGMQAGSDYENIANPRKYVPTSGSFNEFDVTAIAQAWADGAANHGVVVRSTSSDGAFYLSDDTAQPGDRPVLILDTATPGGGTVLQSATNAACDATYIFKGSSGSNYGTVTQFNTDADPDAERMRSLIAFPDLIGNGFNQVPEGMQVLSATLRLHTQNTSAWAGSPGTHSIHQVLTDWSEGTVTWDNFNDGGVVGTDYLATSLDSIVPGLTDSFYYCDVTEAVQNWASGQGNFGWMLMNSIGDRANWDSDDASIAAYRPMLIVQWVPEPSTFLLSAFGLLGLGFVRRRRKS